MSKKIVQAICTFETDCSMLKCVVSSVKESPFPEVRACLPELVSALNRLNSVNFDEYFTEKSEK